jgi:hypothetical protein
MIFLAATFSHAVVSIVLCIVPMSMKWHKGITNLYVLSSVILMAYSIMIFTLMFGFGLFHLSLARSNTSTNEKLRGVYKKKSNPWNEGTEKNWVNFTYSYPNTPSNVFDNQKSLAEDEENFYHSILKRYGKLVLKKVSNGKSGELGDEQPTVDYNNHGQMKMMLSSDRISINLSENNV